MRLKERLSEVDAVRYGELSMPSAKRPPVVLLLPLGWAIVAIGSIVWSFWSEQAVHAAFGSLASLTACLPLLSPQYRMFSPWTPVAAAISLAAGLRGLVLSAGIEGRVSHDALWLLGRDPDYFVPGYAIYLLGVVTLTLSYLRHRTTSAGEPVRRLPRPIQIGSRVVVVIILCAAVGLISFLFFAYSTDGFSLSSFSEKRTTIDSVELSSEYQSFGVLRWINGTSQLAFWFAIAYFKNGREYRNKGAIRTLFLFLLFLNAIALPVYASSRLEVAFVVIVALIIYGLVNPAGISARKVLPLVVVLISMLAVMTFLRASLQSNVYSAVSADALLTSATEGIVYSRNLGDMATSAHIVNSVPGSLEFQNGATIAKWLVAPIPRAIWPDKPLIAPGPIIGNVIFGTDRSGVPPGYIGEMYLNFGVLGVVIGCLIFGQILSWIEGRFPRSALLADPLLAVTYAVVFFRFGLLAYGLGLGAGLYRIVSDLVLLVVVSMIISGRVALSERSSAKSATQMQVGVRRRRSWVHR